MDIFILGSNRWLQYDLSQFIKPIKRPAIALSGSAVDNTIYILILESLSDKDLFEGGGGAIVRYFKNAVKEYTHT